jgi:FkbM family methyltransferase
MNINSVIARTLRFVWGRKILQGLFLRMHRIALLGMNFGGGADFRTSGELWVLHFIAMHFLSAGTRPIVFDVGANRGEYTVAMVEVFERVGVSFQVHSFEPARETFSLLRTAVAGNRAVYAHNSALGKEPGKLLLYTDVPTSGMASVHKRHTFFARGSKPVSEEIVVTTLDAFCLDNALARVDFIKLDVEGNELAVLEGAKRMLSAGNIGFIQFEFGGTDVDSRVFFRDFYELLSPTHVLYRVLRDGLCEVKEYREADEIFVTTNYFAIPKSVGQTEGGQ